MVASLISSSPSVPCKVLQARLASFPPVQGPPASPRSPRSFPSENAVRNTALASGCPQAPSADRERKQTYVSVIPFGCGCGNVTIHGASLLVLGMARDNRFQPIRAQPEAGAGPHLDSDFKAKRRGSGVPPRTLGLLTRRGGR